MSLCKLFGLSRKDEVIEQDVEFLMPTTFSFHHKEFLTIS